MKHKKVLKGFTLIELIVVIAIFGMIMAVALGLLAPLSRINQSAVATADKQGISEDLRRFIENNVQYADRMAVYTNYSFAEDSSNASLNKQIEEFRKKYYFVGDIDGFDKDGNSVKLNRKYSHAKLKGNDEIYVLQIDNPDSTVISNAIAGTTLLSKVANTDADRLGKVILRKYKSGVQVDSRTWALNTNYYDDYAFNINLQTMAEQVVDGTSTYSLQSLNGSYSSTDPKLLPSNFSIGITMYQKNRKKGEPSKATLSDTNTKRTVSFMLKNIVDKKNNMFNETIEFETPDVESKKVGRYIWYDSTPSYTFAQKLDPAVAVSNDIYIIFTKSPDIQTIVK